MSKMTNSLKITKGTWKVNEYNTGIGVEGLHYKDVPHSTAWREESFCYEQVTEESKANDLLMASSKTLLENEYQNKKDADEAMDELEKFLPDMSVVFDLLSSIAGRAKTGVENATGQKWSTLDG